MDDALCHPAGVQAYPASEKPGSDPHPSSRNTRPNRGRCRAACQDKNLRERQAIGARDVAARRRATSIQAITQAYARLVTAGTAAPGRTPTAMALAAAAGTCIRTVGRHRRAALAPFDRLGDGIQTQAQHQPSAESSRAQPVVPASTGHRRTEQ